MKKILKKHKIEIIIITCILLVSILAIIIINLLSNKGRYVVVIYNQKEQASYALDKDIEVDLTYEENHYNKLVIKDGKASIVEASCPDKICVKTYSISKVGETIVCLPNKVVIKIVGQKTDVDVVT